MNNSMKTALMIFMAGMILCLVALFSISRARAESDWWNEPEIAACCSGADAVYADEWTINRDGSARATVTGGGPRNHAWAPIGRVYEIPADKVVKKEGNPTGRPILFLNRHDLNIPYCFAKGLEG